MKITKLTVGALVVTLFIFSCGIQREGNNGRAGRLALRDTSQVQDSLEYELIIFDPGFDYWLSSRSFQKNQYTNSYLQTINNLYVNEWNRRYSMGDRRIESYIDYSPFNEYDFELNYKLFMYFKFFEERYKVKLLPNTGR
ncbi:MAG: DUF6146 family protein [Bacteroidales bacterium]|nr:DUF6146 family protein [Bacteroidales bacterium]